MAKEKYYFVPCSPYELNNVFFLLSTYAKWDKVKCLEPRAGAIDIRLSGLAGWIVGGFTIPMRPSFDEKAWKARLAAEESRWRTISESDLGFKARKMEALKLSARAEFAALVEELYSLVDFSRPTSPFLYGLLEDYFSEWLDYGVQRCHFAP